MAPAFLVCLCAFVLHVDALHISSTSEESCYYCTHGEHWRWTEELPAHDCTRVVLSQGNHSEVDSEVCSKSAMVRAMKHRFEKHCQIELPVGEDGEAWKTEYKKNDTYNKALKIVEGLFRQTGPVDNDGAKSALLKQFGAGSKWSRLFPESPKIKAEIEPSLRKFSKLPVVQSFIEKEGHMDKDRLCKLTWQIDACNFEFCKGNDQSAADSGKTFEDNQRAAEEVVNLRNKVENLEEQLWNCNAEDNQHACRKNVESLEEQVESLKNQVKTLEKELKNRPQGRDDKVDLKKTVSRLQDELLKERAELQNERAKVQRLENQLKICREERHDEVATLKDDDADEGCSEQLEDCEDEKEEEYQRAVRINAEKTKFEQENKLLLNQLQGQTGKGQNGMHEFEKELHRAEIKNLKIQLEKCSKSSGGNSGGRNRDGKFDVQHKGWSDGSGDRRIRA